MKPEITMVQISKGGPLGIQTYLGTEADGDEVFLTFEQRIKNCYHLAGYAVVFGEAGRSSRLVHGSWQGPTAEQRIGHAWVELPNGLIWEPIFAAIFDGEELRRYARMWDERTYDYHVAKKMIQSSGHWGRWHESRYP